MEDIEYQPGQYRETFPLDFKSQRYEYQKQKYSKPVSYGSTGYERAPAGADNIDNILKADRYITGQTVENIIAMIGMRCFLKKKIQGELQHLKEDLQDRINQTMYFGDRIPPMLKRRSDLERQLFQVDTEAIKEEQIFWKDIMMLTKELRYKLEEYRKEKVKEGFF